MSVVRAMALRAVLGQPETLSQHQPDSARRTWMMVCLLFLLGVGLRVTHLDLKTAWMDEVSTVIFSLGNSSYFLPTEQIVDLEALLRPLIRDASAAPIDSARYLLQENNHPPAYFMLAHLWMDWFTADGAVASLAMSRLFAALLGSLSVPAIFWVAKNTFQSSTAGLLSAAFMAVSPFSLFLSQEARHYGLGITLISLSLGCFVIATRAVLTAKTPDWLLCGLWVLINAFAFANHYFSALTFAAEGLVLAAIAIQQVQQRRLATLWQPYWRPIYAVAAATALSIFLWLPVLLNFHGSPQTTFLRESGPLMRWVNPLAQTLAAILTSFATPANFFAQTPFDFVFIGITILLTLLFIGKFIPALIKGAKSLNQVPQGHIGLVVIGGFWVAMLGIFAFICYVYGSDITRGLRYKFTYYPALMVLAGGIFAQYWQGRSPRAPLSVSLPFSRRRVSGRRFVQFTWVAGLISALMIINNLAFPKYYAPDRFIPYIQTHSTHPIVLASTEKVFEQPTVIGAKFLSLAWEIDRHFSPDRASSGWQVAPQFFTLKQGYGTDQPVTQRFTRLVNQLSMPADVWVIRSEIDENDPLIIEKPEICQLAPETPQGNKGGYLYIHFQCGASVS